MSERPQWTAASLLAAFSPNKRRSGGSKVSMDLKKTLAQPVFGDLVAVQSSSSTQPGLQVPSVSSYDFPAPSHHRQEGPEIILIPDSEDDVETATKLIPEAKTPPVSAPVAVRRSTRLTPKSTTKPFRSSNTSASARELKRRPILKATGKSATHMKTERRRQNPRLSRQCLQLSTLNNARRST